MKSITSNRLKPGRELAVLATLRQASARDLARRSGVPEWRVGRILSGIARPTLAELGAIRQALFEEEAGTPPARCDREDEATAGATETPPAV